MAFLIDPNKIDWLLTTHKLFSQEINNRLVKTGRLFSLRHFLIPFQWTLNFRR
jgi:hypothetical protein